MNRTLRLLYLPILAIAMMAVCVPQAQAQVASVTVGEQTTTYLTLQEAFAAAASAESATLQMLQDVTLEEGKKFELESGNITLDLNGKTITGQTGSTLLRAWGDINLSILDSSTEQTGTISNHGSVLVQRGGSLAISGGTFIGANAIEIGDAQISGGRFITTATNKSAVNTDNPRLGLAMDYAYFNTASGEMLVMRDYWNRLCNSKGAIATDVTVKRATVAAVTIGEQTTTYTSSTLAFSDAVSAGQPATIKLLADVNIPEFSDISFEFTQGDVTLDLNGKAIRQGNYSAQLYSAIKVDGGKLTIIDSSASKSGKVEGRVTADGGTLVIKSGVVNGYFEAHYSANVTLYGGRFVNMDGDVIYTEFESILAEGYELFDAHSGEQVSLRVFDNLQNADVVVLPIKTAASVTIGEETTEYASFRKALAVAKAAEAATIKIHDDILVAEQLIERTLDGDREFSYFGLAFNQGDVTLDLNGHTITGQILGEKIFPEALAYLDNGGKLTLVDS
ncbi:MAG: hypothetical protein Q4B68_07025, partial [Bacteroidales bacterium]|nr:hypothetical protein [Bacteroidales bacterium]